MFFIYTAIALLLVALGGLAFALYAKRQKSGHERSEAERLREFNEKEASRQESYGTGRYYGNHFEPKRYTGLDPRGGYLVAAVAGGLLLLFTLFNSFTTVDARSIGIQTAFGRYQSTMGPGLQTKAPWSSVEEFTTRIQDTDLSDKDGGKEAVNVAFSAPDALDANGKPIADQTDQAGGGNGRISSMIRWGINPDQGNNGARALWEKFRTFEDVQTRLVLSESQQAVTDVANDYTAGIASVNQTLIGDAVLKNLQGRLSKYGIVVDSVAIKGVDLDGPTKASLQRIVDNINKTQAAVEEKNRAIIDNQTAKLRAESGALSAQANERYCLDVVNAWDVTKNGPLPATFNCGLGGNPPVLVGAGK